jgi:hypothetical protein
LLLRVVCSISLLSALAAGCAETPSVVARDASAWDITDAMLPNLTAIIRRPVLEERVFSPTACEVMEGCTGPGARRLLRFDLWTPNVGRGDIALGSPTAPNRPPGMFEFGLCHNHWHLRGYADYRLFALDGREAAVGHKQSFCIEDTEPYVEGAPPVEASQRFVCSNQGLHAGWADVYGRGLDCQYVDVTDVAPGTYRLRAAVNVERAITESRYDDNEATLVVEITPRSTDAGAPDVMVTDAGLSPDPTRACEREEIGPYRECAWTVGAASRCTPGATVTLGCSAGCAPPLGRCEGDPMIRVCEGDAVCVHASALATLDEACPQGANRCASVTFRCPASGIYRPLTGAFRSGASALCELSAR